MGPVFTVVGTAGGCVGGAAVGTVIIPIPFAGTLIGAGLGGFIGYYTTSFFANMTGFTLGGAAAGAFVYSQLLA